MSAHFPSSFAAPPTCRPEKFCLNIENNHKFMSSCFKYILYIHVRVISANSEWTGSVGALLILPTWKMVFPKVQAASTIDDAKIYIFPRSARLPKAQEGEAKKRQQRKGGFVAELKGYLCFSQKWIRTYVSLFCEAHIWGTSLGKYFIVFRHSSIASQQRSRIKYTFSLPVSIQFSQKLFDDVDLWLLELKIKSISWVCVAQCVCERVCG